MYAALNIVNQREIDTLATDSKSERKQKILAEARNIISEAGGSGLNMKDLARLTGIPRASLYRIYSSREQLIGELTLNWGLSLADRLQRKAPRGHSNGARIKTVFRSILQEAEDNPLLIGAVLENLLSANDSTHNRQIALEELLPTLLASVVNCDAIPQTRKVMDVLLRLLLANLQMQSSGRSQLKESLNTMVFAAEKLMGEEYWKARP